MFLHNIEEFHLELGKEIPGSTISIGGDEKKTKILMTFNAAMLEGTQASHIIQGTEDATKFNECLSPSSFALMHKFFFDEDTRITWNSNPTRNWASLSTNCYCRKLLDGDQNHTVRTRSHHKQVIQES
jgi:hypothetical protein